MIFPKSQIIENSHIKDYEKLYQSSIDDIEGFWENIAHQLYWFKPWNKVLHWQYPYARWFVNAQTNIVYNALDRFMKTEKKDKLALIWVGQDMQEKRYTYKQLNEEVCRLANGLKTLGVKKGDRVTIYLPKIPQQIISMLACAKIGAIHSVVYSGFSAEALKTRIQDAQAKVVICANAYPYKDKIVDSLSNVKEAIKDCSTVENIIIVQRVKTGGETEGIPPARSSVNSEKNFIDNQNNVLSSNQTPKTLPNEHWWEESRGRPRFLYWNELIAKQDTLCSTEIMDANDPLFILYTSGTTGKPKGVVHGHGGYMVGVYITMKWVFDLKDNDLFFCTADPGWITGHSYMTYGPLLNGITSLIYESVPDYPHPGRWWEVIEKYKPTIFYTTPTAIRALMRYGEEIPTKYNFSSLRILGSVGEPINPAAWLWFYKNIGRENTPPIMDTWWQTETGMHILTPLPSVPLKPGSCFKPFFGIMADVVNENGQSVEPNKQGYLVIKTPWPAMLLDLWQNPKKYRETYFEKIKYDTNDVNNVTAVDGASEVTLRETDGGIHSRASQERRDHERQNLLQLFKNFIYFTGDSAKIDNDGYFWIIGRNDDVIKVAGHRLGSAEIEHIIVSHQAVAEAAVIGKPDKIKGETIKAFVILKAGQKASETIKQEINQLVKEQIGPIAIISEIEFVNKLPKTRSGKIMRRVLKAKELGLPIGDTSTLED